jgi:hypothetical protein
MPNLSLAFQRIEYVTDRQVTITAWRAFAEVAFLTRNRAGVTFSCVVDPGAPFSVIPYSLWQSRKMDWQRLEDPGQAEREHGVWNGRMAGRGL